MKKIILIIILGIFIEHSFSQKALSEKYNLMPWPQEVEENNTHFIINEKLTISVLGADLKKRAHKASVSFLRRLSNRTGIFINTGFPVKTKKGAIEINFETVSNLNIESDESYSLEIKSNKVKINAKTDVGAVRGLETLLQLVNFNSDNHFFEGVTIKDSPRFVWRGLMIDVARHFQPIDVIKRNLKAMASVKLNVFHWHLTDDQGFRVESKVYPRLQEIAADGLFYTQEQIKDVVAFASDLGIRVVPEFDVPGHASAILAAYPELGSKEGYDYKVERFAGVFDPTLNPAKEVTYLFLETLFREIAPLFPDEYFHIGGDENEGKHWNENVEIKAFKRKHKLKTNHDLQTFFNIKLEKILKKLDKKLMGWDEILTPSLPTTAVIHSWRGKHEGLKQSTLIEAAKKGYQTVLSNGYYIDRVLSVEHHYLVDPIGNEILTKEELKRVLGAEATMWSELVTPLTIDSRIWPRTAAIAERFWSSKGVKDVENMKKRLKVVNNQLEELGITHIKNKAVILRNLTKNQDIKPLKVLSKIYEPLKIYSRNKGGTEYKSFSPFTLFADACSVDADDAIAFNKATESFLRKYSKEDKDKIVFLLNKWSNNYNDFFKLEMNPLLKNIEASYRDLNSVSIFLLKVLRDKKVPGLKERDLIKKSVDNLRKPMEDTELMIHLSLEKLIKNISLNE
ncbi:beta-N-acetylhexosaminidase [Tenacibaculum sp. Bg11-29]|uniref:beta-N-acetylhexosaminidase n=1 Tax=Tenacibaculum sp. Bg11-29 TaxID=2058306 RepID=UPI000C32770A|nr:family 20 glycosylhydrolase [Tenacibaculum sp. Bg11-29]PKH51347.1 beta-N-acetylhexosaminidase [Tenacibaculum sp. Bg11-29]